MKYPLGGRGHQKELLRDPVLTKIAESHGKSVAQVILRWNIQRDIIAIPGSSNVTYSNYPTDANNDVEIILMCIVNTFNIVFIVKNSLNPPAPACTFLPAY